MNEYSGRTWYTYSSKIKINKPLKKAAKNLVTSKAFAFSLSSDGIITYTNKTKTQEDQLKITTNNTLNGIYVRNHDKFIESQKSALTKLAFKTALDLHLSTLKLFSQDFGFPREHIRIFSHPIYIRNSGSNESYDGFLPYINLYIDGLIQITLAPLGDFENKAPEQILHQEINRFQIDIDSVLGCEGLLGEIINLDYDNFSPFKKAIGIIPTSRQREKILKEKEIIELGEISDEVVELLHLPGSNFCLTDLCLNFLDICGNIINRKDRHLPSYWLNPGRSKIFRSSIWTGKPNLYIETHTDQRPSSRENLEAHKAFIQSTITRVHSKHFIETDENVIIDLRPLDDFNHIYSESSTTVLIAKDAHLAISASESFTFENLVADCQIKNETAQLLAITYENLIDELSNTTKAQDLYALRSRANQLEEQILRSTRRLGEISSFFKSVQDQPELKSSIKHLEQKFLTVEQLLNFKEKISSEKHNKKLTIVFGIIASVSISPEIIQPIAKLLDWRVLYSENWGKITCALTAFLVTIIIIKGQDIAKIIQNTFKNGH
ncbi:hypothetical protein PKB_0840 [Pseudomonas knackmussii B13]|uniref:Uncharacterized protein n=1 Tax=Pseudomonas knackmussii (strain DSM 6978 / CCUG 54928 / LMG 23759 / B13) TaxID=1301098 RepID=A0A024HCK9_PSEKB|nr:hypothetical protein [Pseudomonas knackmussii]CDF82208.1 hypothetical protein PKB_0840 [Pseudomonas knackmussii B13]